MDSHNPGGVVSTGGGVALVFLMRTCSNQAGQNRYDFRLVGRDQAMHIANRVAPRTPNESIFGKPHVHWLFRHVAHPTDGFVGGTGGHPVSDVQCLIPTNRRTIVAILVRLVATLPH